MWYIIEFLGMSMLVYRVYNLIISYKEKVK